MYTITLEVNQICNLECTYCYLREKTNQKMKEDIAYKGLEIAFLNAAKHKDKRLWVDFVGGEALISFAFLQKLVEYIEEQATKRKITVSYSITTNGTIMNDEILKWLINNSVHLKLSIDGFRETHDRNRKTKFGIGSYRNIMGNLNYFREYEERSKQFIQVAHVVTQNNYWEAFKSVKHLVEDLHFSIVDTSINVTHRWTVEQLDKLGWEWENILCYYIKRIESGRAFLWAPVLDLKKYGEESENSRFCGVGLIQTYVKVDGGIYGCAANLDSSGCLGDVERGVSVRKIKKYRELANKSTICLKCDILPKCQSCKCIMNNLAYSNQINGHNPDMCYFEKKKIDLWNKYDKKIR